MRILVHDYVGHPFQVQLSRELARRSHHVTHAFAGGLLTPRGLLQRKAEDPRLFEIREVSMDPEYRANKYNFTRRRRMELDYGQRLVQLIREVKPELVISGNTPTEPQWAAAKFCRTSGVRFVTWIQDFYGLAVDRLLRKRIPILGYAVGRWYRLLERRMLCLSDGIVAITPDFVPILGALKVPTTNTTVIPNWAPLDEIAVMPKSNPWSRRMGLDKEFSFLYSGTLALKHNPALLTALAANFRSHPSVRVVVVSEGPGADWLKAQKESGQLNNLELLPFQDFSMMSEVLASADVLLAVLEPDAGVFSVPSKVLTYHCAARPVLGSIPNENLAARIIAAAGSGLCVSPGRDEEFLASAEKLFIDSQFRELCGLQARKYADENFEISRVCDRFEDHFSKTLSKGIRGGR